MAVTVAAYFDESALKGGGVYALAGYAGRVDMWDNKFDPAWRALLKEFGVGEFKTSDCRHGREEFKGWPKEKRDALTIRVVSTIIDTTPTDEFFGFGAVLVYPGFANKEHHRHLEEGGFLSCFMQVCYRMALIAYQHLGKNEELQLVFDNKPSFHKLVADHYEIVMAYVGPEIAQKMPYPVFCDSMSVTALQAADLLAYETRKEAQSRVDGENRKVSRALQRLAGEREHEADAVTWVNLQRGLRARNLGHTPAMHPELSPVTMFKTGERWRAPHHWPYHLRSHAEAK